MSTQGMMSSSATAGTQGSCVSLPVLASLRLAPWLNLSCSPILG